MDELFIILTSTSEVDVVSKLLCKKINAESKAGRINQYRDEINAHFAEIKNIWGKIFMISYFCTITIKSKY